MRREAAGSWAAAAVSLFVSLCHEGKQRERGGWIYRKWRETRNTINLRCDLKTAGRTRPEGTTRIHLQRKRKAVAFRIQVKDWAAALASQSSCAGVLWINLIAHSNVCICRRKKQTERRSVPLRGGKQYPRNLIWAVWAVLLKKGPQDLNNKQLLSPQQWGWHSEVRQASRS